MSMDVLEVDDVLKEYISKDNSSTEDTDERKEYPKKTNSVTCNVNTCYHKIH